MRVVLTITHIDCGLTESYDMSYHSWQEVIKDHLMFPTYNYQWVIQIESNGIVCLDCP